MVSPMQVPNENGKENSFKEGRNKLGGLQQTEPIEELRVGSTVAFYWLSCDSFSLAELLPARGNLSSSCWALLLSLGVRAPPSGGLTLF